MKFSNTLFAITLTIASLGIAAVAKADMYPKGEDCATSSGPCTFSQRQGTVGIELENGDRYDLVPVGEQPGTYRDQNANPLLSPRDA